VQMSRTHRVAGALVGAAVGDALAAPFASGPPGQFSARFPTDARGAATEMLPTPGRAPGEFADDALGPVQEWIAAAAAGTRSAGLAELVRMALDGGDAMPTVQGDPVVAAAVEVVRPGRSFAEVLRRAVDRGGDVRPVARAAGALAGAVYGIAGIPMRWTSVVHGRVPGQGDRVLWLADLQHLAAVLDGSRKPPYEAPETRGLAPREVADGVWAADLDGARYSSPDFAVVSLCRTGPGFRHEVHRLAYLTDDDANSELDAVLDDVLSDIAALRAEGRPVLVHCFAGQSRTGLVLRAWLRRTQGLSAAEATAVVRQRWPHLSEWNDTFTAALERVSPTPARAARR
jgi:hypothetical protein